MNSVDCIDYLIAGELPSCLNFNLDINQMIDFNKINYNDYTKIIINQKRHKYLLKMQYYDLYLNEQIIQAHNMGPLQQWEQLRSLTSHNIDESFLSSTA